jgi:AraC-like DNA-binding protein
MRYFRDLEFVNFAHVPRCSVWIDRYFDQYWALNFAPSGRIAWGAGRDGRRVTYLNAPVAWWTWPGRHFRYGCGRGESWDQWFVTFHGPRARRMFAEGIVPSPRAAEGRPVAPVADPEAFRRDWERLFALLDAHGRRDNPEAVHLLEGMLLRLSGRPAAATTVGEMAALATAIRAAPEREWDWAAEANRLAVSPVHLRRRFRAAVGLPPHRFLIQARMEQAARLLLTTDLPAKAVGAAVGVGDPYYFSKLFKAHFRLPPDRYRREADPYAAAAAASAAAHREKSP